MADMIEKGVTLAVGVLVVGILVAFLLPTAIGAFNSDTSQTEIQQEDTTYQIGASLEANATDINSTSNEVTLELNDTSTAGTTTKTISEGNNATYSLNNGDVNVTVDSVNSDTEAQITYDYESTFGWDNGPAQLFNLLPLFFVLVILMFVIGAVIKY